MKNFDTLINLLIVASIALGTGSIVTAITKTQVQKETLQKACGSCEQRAQVCGEFTCTQDGWK